MTLADQLAACFPALTVDIDFNIHYTNILGRSLKVLSSEMDLAKKKFLRVRHGGFQKNQSFPHPVRAL